MVQMSINLEPNYEGKPIYFADESLKGVITLKFDKDTKVKALKVKIVGESTVFIPSGRHGFYQDETYLEKEILIFRNNIAKIMYTGNYQYDFEFQFPWELPQSTKIRSADVYNSINYYCVATLDIPWKLNNSCKQAFILRRRDDLNKFPVLRMPILKRFEKRFYGCFICLSGKLLIEVSLPYSGFISRQIVPLKIKYENRSAVKIDRTKIMLEERKVMLAGRKKLEEKTILVKHYISGVDSFNSAEYDNSIKIPKHLDPSDILWSNSIKIKHYIRIIGMVNSKMHFNPTITIPIVIGTTALSETAIEDEKLVNHPEMLKHLSEKNFRDRF